jgi:hypothetical protein
MIVLEARRSGVTKPWPHERANIIDLANAVPSSTRIIARRSAGKVVFGCLGRQPRRFAMPVDDLPRPSAICLARHCELSGPASHPALRDELWTGPRPAGFHIPLMCLGPWYHEYFAWTFTSLEILGCATDSFAHAKAAYQEIVSRISYCFVCKTR